MCVSFLCVTFVTLANGCCVCFWRVSGDTVGKGTPSPFWGRATVRLPPSKFFIFFLPYPITSSISPFSFPLRGFLFLCVYFPIHVSFRVSEDKNTGKIRIAFPILPVSMWLLYALFSFYILILCYFLCYVFRLYLPIVLLSVLCSCIVFCCGCCVFR